jgi:hypothetical protein
MTFKTVAEEDIRNYLAYSKEINEIESTLYESGDELSQEESRIEKIVKSQNKIRFDNDEKDIFRDQLEHVIRTLASNYKNYDFEHNIYFDLVYNLLLLEYDRFETLIREDGINKMLQDIGIDEHLKGRIKALLDHEKEGGCGCN